MICGLLYIITRCCISLSWGEKKPPLSFRIHPSGFFLPKNLGGSFLAAHLYWALWRAQRGTRVCRNHQFPSFSSSMRAQWRSVELRRKKGQNERKDFFLLSLATFLARFMIKCWSQRIFLLGLLTGRSGTVPSTRNGWTQWTLALTVNGDFCFSFRTRVEKTSRTPDNSWAWAAK